jgi:hypothetical protein
MAKPDILLDLRLIPIAFLDATHGEARAEGNNATWLCPCGDPVPIMGRCYFAFGYNCHTVCQCGRQYHVIGDEDKRAERVEEY